MSPRELLARLKGYFFDRKFFHYAWSGVLISTLNVFFLWVLIDKLHISTVVSSILVVGVTFILRYVILRSTGY